MSGYPYPSAPAVPRSLRGARVDQHRRPGPAVPLLLTGLCLAALMAVWAIAEFVPSVHAEDAVLLGRFLSLDYGHISGVAEHLPHLLSPTLFTIWGVALVLIAIARERPRVALAIATIMALAPLSAELLKPLLAEPHLPVGITHINAASFPSGHSTAAAVLAASAVLVTPRRFRVLAIVLAVLFVLAIGAALLIRAWHMPSDVLGGYLLALAWTSLAVACLRASALRWPARSTPPPAERTAPPA
ncbi:MAG TPA: phosphatase PAP2 family protein [Solirubrobacteraceae bacterium]|jgi:membrane-associated phospholipid phosphatase|nr:phosphatase PAP2 family protein [Solirubrobacteraceae bacterium]